MELGLSQYIKKITPTSSTNSDRSVADTITLMIQIAKVSSQDPKVIAVTKQAVRLLDRESSDREICTAIFKWIKENVQFLEDEEINYFQLGMDITTAMDTELLITPPALLSMPRPMGDCDDFSTLCAAMLLVLNFHCAFVTVAVDKDDEKRFSHVYVKAWLQDENKGLYMDCSHGPYVGWETDKYTRKVEWGIN